MRACKIWDGERVKERLPHRTKYCETERPTVRRVEVRGPHGGGLSAWHGWLWTVGKPLSTLHSLSLNASLLSTLCPQRPPTRTPPLSQALDGGEPGETVQGFLPPAELVTGVVQIATLRKYLHATPPEPGLQQGSPRIWTPPSDPLGQSGAETDHVFQMCPHHPPATPHPLIKTLCSSQLAAFTIPSAHWIPPGLQACVHTASSYRLRKKDFLSSW